MYVGCVLDVCWMCVECLWEARFPAEALATARRGPSESHHGGQFGSLDRFMDRYHAQASVINLISKRLHTPRPVDSADCCYAISEYSEVARTALALYRFRTFWHK